MQWIDDNLPFVLRVFGTSKAQCKRRRGAHEAVRAMIRRDARELKEVADNAEGAPRGGALTRIQDELSALPPAVPAPMRVLVVMAVGGADNEAQMSNLGEWLHLFDDYDFYVYSYACETDADLDGIRKRCASVAAGGRRKAAPPAERPREVRLRPKVGSGCKLAFWVHAIEAAKQSSASYTHVWFVDNDLSVRHFHKRAFEALVRHNAPLVCQPGILARASGARGSDHALCNARFASGAARMDNFYSLAYDFRGRRLRAPADVARNSLAWSIGGVEVMCPLLDCRLLDAFHKVVRTFDDRSDWACERVFNQLATEFAAYAASLNVPRVSKLVLDFVPLIHMDTRTIGKASACKREDLDVVGIQQVCSLLSQAQDAHCSPLQWVDQSHSCSMRALPSSSPEARPTARGEGKGRKRAPKGSSHRGGRRPASLLL